jgi:hypothetical protein
MRRSVSLDCPRCGGVLRRGYASPNGTSAEGRSSLCHACRDDVAARLAHA